MPRDSKGLERCKTTNITGFCLGFSMLYLDYNIHLSHPALGSTSVLVTWYRSSVRQALTTS